MKIIQISDLHINDNTKIDVEKKIIDKLFKQIEKKVSKTEELIFMICGDIIDRGKFNYYEKSKIILDYLKEKSSDYQYRILFVPGNHDLVLDQMLGYSDKIKPFNDFINNFSTQNNFRDKHIVGVDIENNEKIRFILINSMCKANKDYGSIDYDQLKEELNVAPEKKIILVGHHTLTSRYQDDGSAIRNIYELNEIIEENKNIIAYIHGHTHGYSDMVIGKNCKIIGVGPWHKNTDVHRQFNLIDIKAGEVNNIFNFYYLNDRRFFDNSLVYERLNFNSYVGNDLERLYSDVVLSTKEYACIYNLNINYKNNFIDFIRIVEDIFSEQIEIAENWQKLEVPEDLYYNHGSYMKVKDEVGLDFIIKELTKKATSSRALIPLINLKSVIESGDGFLPSFDIVQFGFDSETKQELHVTLYLRALEVNHFLKINICEIYLMAKKIKSKIGSVNKINLNILAFRAQYKEKYGCFKKAQLDIIKEGKLTKFLMAKDYKIIAELLNEKLDLSETVVEDDGIIKLCNAIEIEVEDQNTLYKNLFEMIKSLKNLYNELKTLRENTSDYKKIERYEDKIKKQISKTITELNEMEENK